MLNPLKVAGIECVQHGELTDRKFSKKYPVSKIMSIIKIYFCMKARIKKFFLFNFRNFSVVTYLITSEISSGVEYFPEMVIKEILSNIQRNNIRMF